MYNLWGGGDGVCGVYGGWGGEEGVRVCVRGWNKGEQGARIWRWPRGTHNCHDALVDDDTSVPGV
jgi:hypothetical protein